MKRWLLFLLVILSSMRLVSQARVSRDSTYVEPRSFNNGALRELHSQKDFQYFRSKELPISLWDKLWNWFWWKVGELFSTKGGRTTIWSLLVLVAIVVIVYFVMKVTGMDRNGLFGRGIKSQQKYRLSHNDIHRISFEEEIEKAVTRGDFRLAIRLHFLQALKMLSDKGHIDWRINKTNTDYLAEIAARPFYDRFTMLTVDFEYSWYGEKQVTKEEFSDIKLKFQQFNNQLQ